MTSPAPQNLSRVLEPLRSLLAKSEKAVERLADDSLQRRRLDANIRALRLSLHTLSSAPAAELNSTDSTTKALAALDQMIQQTEVWIPRFSVGSSQHTLLSNRLNALETARTRLASCCKE